MKNKLKIMIMTFIIIIQGKVYCSDWCSPSIKLGVNFNKFNYKNNAPNKYLYTPGFLIGISEDIELNKIIYLSNDLYYKNTISKMEYTGVTGNVYYGYHSKYLGFSISAGFNVSKKLSLLCGIDLSRLLRANFLVSLDKKSKTIYKKNITSKMSLFYPSLAIGLSHKVRIEKMKFVIGLKYIVGLNKYKLYSQFTGIESKFRNHNISLTTEFLLFLL